MKRYPKVFDPNDTAKETIPPNIKKKRPNCMSLI